MKICRNSQRKRCTTMQANNSERRKGFNCFRLTPTAKNTILHAHFFIIILGKYISMQYLILIMYVFGFVCILYAFFNAVIYLLLDVCIYLLLSNKKRKKRKLKWFVLLQSFKKHHSNSSTADQTLSRVIARNFPLSLCKGTSIILTPCLGHLNHSRISFKQRLTTVPIRGPPKSVNALKQLMLPLKINS